MDKLEEKYIKFADNIKNVVLFMHFINSQKKDTQNPDVLELLETVTQSSVPYNATIISLYGSVELFIDEITETYIDEAYKIVGNYYELPQKMREKHETTSGEFLTNPGRFSNYGITKERLIKNLNDCLNGEKNALINMKMILRHGGNLASEQIFQFYNGIGVEDFKGKFFSNEVLVETYAEQKELSIEDAKLRLKSLKKDAEGVTALFMELDNLVEQRNQVAHSGRVDEKKTFKYIEDNTIPFLILFGKVIKDILTNDLIALSLKKIRL